MRRIVDPNRDEHREELLRPSRFLGYDRDSLGRYALSKQMFEVAESQFTRAVYLNPYEPMFKQHLAWSLYKQGKYVEARRWIEEALAHKPEDEDCRYIAGKIGERMKGHSTAQTDQE